MQKSSYIGYIKDYEGATLMHVSISDYTIFVQVHFWRFSFVWNRPLLQFAVFHLDDESSEKKIVFI